MLLSDTDATSSKSPSRAARSTSSKGDLEIDIDPPEHESAGQAPDRLDDGEAPRIAPEIRDSMMSQLEETASAYIDARVTDERERLEKTRKRLQERARQAEKRREQYTKKLKSLDGHRL